MAHKSLPEQLKAYLFQHRDYMAGAVLSRLEWPKYAYGERRGLHSPRAVIRRLQEMVEAKELVVEYRHGIAYYSANTQAPKKKVQHVETLPNGNARVWYEEVTA